MNPMFRLFWLPLLLGLLACTGSRQSTVAEAPATAPAALAEKAVPLDPEVRTGTLANGLRYYVRYNPKPEQYAELRLAVNAGSLQEDPAQQGLAHFVEHMCFNGSEHFPKSELVDYLESIGTRFGAHLNAYTSFDETVYMLRVPTADSAQFETGFQILEDWAHLVSFETEEIEKERGVVIEEWRTRLGANNRMMQKIRPVLFHDSRYAERLPIGQVDILETFDPEVLRQYYRDWYRPDLMAVVAVGDFDVDQVEAMIQAKFGRIPAAEAARPREAYPMPDHAETFVTMASDPEAPFNSVSVYYKHPVQPVTTLSEYRANLVRRLASTLISNRLDELGQQDNPPFSVAYSRYGNMVRTKDNYVSGAYVAGDGFLRGMEALLVENERARRYGFTATELERAKRSLLSGLEQQYRERDKIESNRIVMSFVYHFLEGSPATGVEQALALHRSLLPGIELEEVNAAFAGFIRDESRVVTLMGSDKEGVVMPSEAEVRQLLTEVEGRTLEPYQDKVADAPLMAELPAPGTIEARATRSELGVTEWTLSNGARVILKPTDFKNDEISLTAFSPGGTSLYVDSLYMSANEAAGIIGASGLAAYDNIQLEKFLSDKVLEISPYISELEEGIDGSCSPQDLETFMQLLHLYFVQPRRDTQAFASLMTRNRNLYGNLLANPQYWFRSELTKALNQGHFRRDFIPTPEKLAQVDLDAAYRIYQERFADASDFTFIFVGNVSPERLAPLVETYLASLPGLNRGESGQDVGVVPPATPLEQTFFKGSEPQSQVVMQYQGDFAWDTENRFRLNAAVQVLSIMMRESMREEQGGVYGVGARPGFQRDPKPRYNVTINFTCAPENVATLMATVEAEAAKLREEGPAEKNLAKIKEIMRKELEVNLKENDYWLGQLRFAYRYDMDPARIYDLAQWIEDLDAGDIQAAAQAYLQPGQLARFILKPEPAGN